MELAFDHSVWWAEVLAVLTMQLVVLPVLVFGLG
jgi:hypothetical protein